MTEPSPRQWTEAQLDEVVTMPVRLRYRDVREINRRAGLRSPDGKARGAYVVGCALGEPHDELLERVRKIADNERARFRAELEADRAKRDRKR